MLNYFNSSTRFFANKSNNPLRKDRGGYEGIRIERNIKKNFEKFRFLTEEITKFLNVLYIFCKICM